MPPTALTGSSVPLGAPLPCALTLPSPGPAHSQQPLSRLQPPHGAGVRYGAAQAPDLAMPGEGMGAMFPGGLRASGSGWLQQHEAGWGAACTGGGVPSVGSAPEAARGASNPLVLQAQQQSLEAQATAWAAQAAVLQLQRRVRGEEAEEEVEAAARPQLQAADQLQPLPQPGLDAALSANGPHPLDDLQDSAVNTSQQARNRGGGRDREGYLRSARRGQAGARARCVSFSVVALSALCALALMCGWATMHEQPGITAQQQEL